MNAVTEVMDELRKALAELEDCRARNANLRTMLEQVTRERDEARAACPDCAMWAERSACWHDDMQRAERERDEAQAERDLARERFENAVQSATRYAVERDEWRDKFLALNQTAGELCGACGWAFRIPGEPCRCEVVKERDEARAEVEHAYREGGALYEAKIAEREAFRCGAEAMRLACQQWCRAWENDGEAIADALADLRVEDKP